MVRQIPAPLAGLASNLRFLRSAVDDLNAEEVKQAVDMSLLHIKQLRQLVGTIAGFQGHAPASFEIANLHDVIRNAVDAVSDEAGRQSVRVNLSLDRASIRCEMDVPMMRDTLVNLLRNAIEAMPDGGLLEVATRQRDGYGGRPPVVLIRVADTGVGIAPDNMRRIFRPLFSTKPRRLGLGLTFSRHAVEEHGGQIRLASAGPNQGTIATVSLPIRSARPLAAPQVDTTPAHM